MSTPSRAAAAAAWLFCLAWLWAEAVAARAPGPIAIAMNGPQVALILRADGRVRRFDTATGSTGAEFYRVPADYMATDLAAAAPPDGPVVTVMLNAKSSATYNSFVLQVYPAGRQVWTWLPQRGVYIGVAVDTNGQYAYATNSTNNRIYRILIGDSNARVTEVAELADADRIGAVAIDTSGGRLFVADIAGGRVFVVPLAPSGPRSVIRLAGSAELRAATWSASARRLLVADAGAETIWVVDPDRDSEPFPIRDRRLRAPSGLTVTAAGQAWGIDEGRNAVFQLQGLRSILRLVSLD